MKLDVLKACRHPQGWFVCHLGVLSVLNDGCRHSIHEIMDATGRSHTAAVNAIRQLEHSGMLVRYPGLRGGGPPRNVISATITDAGREFLQELL